MHAGCACCFDSGRGVFDNQTLAGEQRELARNPTGLVQFVKRSLVAIRRGFMFQSGICAYDDCEIIHQAAKIEHMINLAAFSHADNAKLIFAHCLFNEGDYAGSERHLFLNQ